MDINGFDQSVFESIKADYLKFAEGIAFKPSTLAFVPMSALKGDNVVSKSERSPWYTGQSLMEILETVEIANDRNYTDLRFPVQYVNRPNLDFRGFAGTLASGILRVGDAANLTDPITEFLDHRVDLGTEPFVRTLPAQLVIEVCRQAYIHWVQDADITTLESVIRAGMQMIVRAMPPAPCAT